MREFFIKIPEEEFYSDQILGEGAQQVDFDTMINHDIEELRFGLLKEVAEDQVHHWGNHALSQHILDKITSDAYISKRQADSYLEALGCSAEISLEPDDKIAMYLKINSDYMLITSKIYLPK